MESEHDQTSKNVEPICIVCSVSQIFAYAFSASFMYSFQLEDDWIKGPECNTYRPHIFSELFLFIIIGYIPQVNQIHILHHNEDRKAMEAECNKVPRISKVFILKF